MRPNSPTLCAALAMVGLLLSSCGDEVKPPSRHDVGLDGSTGNDTLSPDGLPADTMIPELQETDIAGEDWTLGEDRPLTLEDVEEDLAPQEICDDGTDNDGDGLIDCADEDCGSHPLCGPELCNDRFDNDGDGQPDCSDPDCANKPFCGAEVCDDDFDNDGDRLVDCADEDCVGTVPYCGLEDCLDGIDNDGDGLVDCSDEDCGEKESCLGNSCLHPLPIAASGIYAVNTSDFVNSTSGSCGGRMGRDAVLAITLEEPAVRVSLDTIGTGFDTVIYVRSGDCEAGEELPDGCNDDAGGTHSHLDLTNLDPGTYYLFLDAYGTGDPVGGHAVISIDIQMSEDCYDGSDNDDDGLIDCEDDDCAGSFACLAENCGDGVDNDRNGLTDCEDEACTNDSLCQGREICGDGLDNDENGLIDCEDPACASDPPCQSQEICGDGLDNDENGLTDCQDPACASDPPCQVQEICGDGLDNNQNGLTDCEDQQCSAEPSCQEENCTDGLDNNGNGLLDCLDPECVSEPTCQAEICTDGLDNNGNGLLDCLDPECLTDPACLGQEICGDGLDNDENGLTDCADPACLLDPSCLAEICGDGVDNDGDGLTDCRDPECDASCTNGGNDICATAIEVTASISYPRSNTTGFHDNYMGSCGGNGPECVIALVLEAGGHITAETVTASFDTVLYLRADCLDPTSELACNNDSASPPHSRLEVGPLAAGTYYLFADGFDPTDLGSFGVTIAILP